jgi:hypothetical protein
MLTVTGLCYTGFIKVCAPNSSAAAVAGRQKKSKLMLCFFDTVQNSTEILNLGLDGRVRLSFHCFCGASIGCGRVFLQTTLGCAVGASQQVSRFGAHS